MKFAIFILATMANLAICAPVSRPGITGQQACYIDLEGVQHCVTPKPNGKRQCLVWKDDDGNIHQTCSPTPPQIPKPECESPTKSTALAKRQCVSWIDKEGNTHQSCSPNPPQVTKPAEEATMEHRPCESTNVSVPSMTQASNIVPAA